MGHVRHMGHIDAPPDRVFALTIDASRDPEWNSSVVEVKGVTGLVKQRGIAVLRGAAKLLPGPAVEVDGHGLLLIPGEGGLTDELTGAAGGRRHAKPGCAAGDAGDGRVGGGCSEQGRRH